jgi:hypothetical protein
MTEHTLRCCDETDCNEEAVVRFEGEWRCAKHVTEWVNMVIDEWGANPPPPPKGHTKHPRCSGCNTDEVITFRIEREWRCKRCVMELVNEKLRQQCSQFVGKLFNAARRRSMKAAASRRKTLP